MPSKFHKFKNLQQRMRRTMHYGKRRLNSLTEPLSKMVVDYFDKNCPHSANTMDMNFLTSFSKNNCVSPCTLLVAMIYIDRFKQTTEQKRSQLYSFTNQNSTEIFLSAMVLATKFLNDGGLDEFIWNDEFASASNFSIAKINKLELEMLDKLDWNLLVDEETFENAFSSAEQWIAMESSKRNGFLTYNEINAFVTESSLPSHYLPLIEQFLKFVLSIYVAYIAAVAIAITLTFASISLRSMTISTLRMDIYDRLQCSNNFENNTGNQFSMIQSNFGAAKWVGSEEGKHQIISVVSESEIRPMPELLNVSSKSALFNMENFVYISQIVC